MVHSLLLVYMFGGFELLQQDIYMYRSTNRTTADSLVNCITETMKINDLQL